MLEELIRHILDIGGRDLREALALPYFACAVFLKSLQVNASLELSTRAVNIAFPDFWIASEQVTTEILKQVLTQYQKREQGAGPVGR
jgi:hypothetical protein